MLRIISEGIKTGLRQPLLSRYRKNHHLVRPFFLNYAVTWRCNARCSMCDTWKTTKENPSVVDEEMSLQEWSAILDRDADFLRDIRKIGLTGGEPFLRDDLPDLIHLLHEGLPQARMSLVSNGLTTGRILKMLTEIRRFFPEMSFSVSLDGVGEVHDKVRGIPGAYAKAMASIKVAKELGFTVTSGMTISRTNYDQIKPLSRELEKLGVDFSCNLMETGINFHSDEASGQLNDEQKNQVAQDLERFSHHYYMDQVRCQIKGQERNLPCFSGLTSYFIGPEGDVAVCNLLGDPLGNLKQTPFKQIADAPSTWKRRDELIDCKCWSQCEVKSSAAVAPWQVLSWLMNKPDKMAFIKRYRNKVGFLGK